MKCWITLTSHSGTVNAEQLRLGNEGRLQSAEIERVLAMSFRSISVSTIFIRVRLLAFNASIR
jgi:hypothetical protein